MDRLTQTLFASLTLMAFVAFIVTPHSTHAQDEPGVAYFGVQGGLNQASFEGGSAASSRQGNTVGVQASYNVNEVFSVEMDFLYAQMGANGVTISGGGNVSDAYDYQNDDVSVSYYHFPALFKLTAPIEFVKARALAGPAISFLAGAEENGTSIQGDLQSEQPVTNRYLLYDFGGVVGGEIALPVSALGESEVALTGRYYVGFTNVDQTQDFSLKNRSFSGSLIFRIPF